LKPRDKLRGLNIFISFKIEKAVINGLGEIVKTNALKIEGNEALSALHS